MLQNAVEKKSLVVVAGAGISVAAPSNLPSWWEFNKLLIDGIKSKTIELLPDAASLVQPIEIGERLPVESISDFFVRSIAGDSYFPLLTLLNAAKPNINHKILAELARQGIISAIVTTNFDTLIEAAFREAHVKLNVIVTEEDYNRCMLQQGCKLLKIHGSATDYDSLVDTVSQKLKGLSQSKRLVLENMISGRHLLFMGFSGADLSFDLDYIPIANAMSKHTGVTWVVRPGTKPHPNVITLKEKYGDQFVLLPAELTELYELLGIDIRKFESTDSNPKEIDTYNTIRDSINHLISAEHISTYGCAALCIDLLHRMGFDNNARQLSLECEAVFNTADLNPANLITYATMGIRCLTGRDFEGAAKNLGNALTCLMMTDACYKSGEVEVTSESTRELLSNSATVLNNIGLYHMEKNELQLAQSYFYKAKESAQKAGKTLTLATIQFNLARINYKQAAHIDNYIKELRQAETLARYSGNAGAIAEIGCELCKILLSLGEYYIVEKKLAELRTVMKVVIDTGIHAAIEMRTAELFVRRGKNDDALALCRHILQQYCGNESDRLSAAISILHQ